MSEAAGELRIYRAADGRGGVKPTKGRRTRVVPLIGLMADELARWRTLAKGPLVVTAPQGGMIRLDNWRDRAFGRACKAAGVVASPKDGRTTYAALRRHQGDDIYRVSAALGHSSIEVTERNYLNTAHYTKDELPLGESMEAAIRKARRASKARPEATNVVPLRPRRKAG